VRIVEINLNSILRRVRIEFFNIVGELPWIFLGFTVITAVLVSAGYDNPERLTWLSMSLSVLLPLAISIAGNTVVLREFSGNSYQFSMSRQRIFTLWLWRLGMVVFSTALYIAIILGAFNLFYPQAASAEMIFAFLVPNLLMIALMSFVSVLTASSTAGMIIGLFFWNYCVLMPGSALKILKPRFFPFADFAISRGLMPAESLWENKLALSLVTLGLFVLTGWQYWNFDRFNATSIE